MQGGKFIFGNNNNLVWPIWWWFTVDGFYALARDFSELEYLKYSFDFFEL